MELLFWPCSALLTNFQRKTIEDALLGLASVEEELEQAERAAGM